MLVSYLPTFKKQFKKLSPKLQDQFGDRLQLFLIDPTSPRLRVHPLKGRYAGYWSLNVSGDLRAIYFNQNGTAVIFALIGTHSELYG